MDASAKQQVVERLKGAQNILVTVSNNPTLDQLAACIGFTLLLNKLGKHATALFSGEVPSIIEFLNPEKTIEHNTDSLQDFIISLDKEKADKLRYKVEDQVVKIFITPYRTSLSEKDLVFSHGDFNVEAVVALGVKDKSQIDQAITAHGRILHDATVISVNSGAGNTPDIGQMNWHEPAASSLSEMLVSISESFGPNLIDNQMATAFLTGIVAETERFSNDKTTPKVMTMSAQLMAAGANQQLIASKLEPAEPEHEAPVQAAIKKEPELPKTDKQGVPDGTLIVSHKEQPKDAPKKAEDSREINIDKDGNILTVGGEPVEPKPEAPQPPDEAEVTTEEKSAPAPPAEAKKEELPLPGTHAFLDNTSPKAGAAFTASTQPGWNLAAQMDALDPLTEPTAAPSAPLLDHARTVDPNGAHEEVKETKEDKPESEKENAEDNTTNTEPPHLEQARSAVESAFAAAPFDPALNPVQALNAAPIETDQTDTAADKDEDDEKEKSSDGPAPPPMPPPPIAPPPIIAAPGVVIPSAPFKNDNNPSADK